MTRSGLTALVLLFGVSGAYAEKPRQSALQQVWNELQSTLQAIVGKRPQPIARKVRYQSLKVATWDIAGSFLDALASDVDHNGDLEWIVFTDQVIQIVEPPTKVSASLTVVKEFLIGEFSRSALGGFVDPIGGLVEAKPGNTFPAYTAWKKGNSQQLSFSWDSPLRADAPAKTGMSFCSGESLQSVLGSAGFRAPDGSSFLQVRCETAGKPDGRQVVARLTADYQLLPGCEVACSWTGMSLVNSGIAYAIFDIDQDGTPEIATSQALLPGQGDALTVWTAQGASAVPPTPNFITHFNGGIVAVLPAHDAGQHAVYVLTRFIDSSKISLWRVAEAL